MIINDDNLDEVNSSDIQLFNEERMRINFHRLRIIVLVFLVISTVLLINDIVVHVQKLVHPNTYNGFVFLHVAMELVLIPYFLYSLLKGKISLLRRVTIKRYILLFYVSYELVLCCFISINAQKSHGQISAFLVALFITSGFFVLTIWESSILFLFGWIVLMSGLYLQGVRFEIFMGHLVNSTIFTVFAIVFSIVNYKATQKKFMSKLSEVRISEELRKLNKEQAELLKRSEEYEILRNNFFANISHEFKTPINLILCAEQMLERIEDDNADRYAKKIRQNCLRLLKLTGNLIDMTKMDAVYVKITSGNYDIIRIVEDISLSVVDYIEECGLSIIFDTEVEEKVITCDPDMIERVMLNLLSNAIKFTNSGGSILVNIYDKGEYVSISVKDTGVGIPKNKQEMIFERFVRVNNSLARKKEGSGIGLALVKSIIDLHDGKIELISEEGKGSEFIIYLPSRLNRESDEKSYNQNNYYYNKTIDRINIEFSDIYR